MNDRIQIECEKIKTDHDLLWYESTKKWRVSAYNRTDSELFVSWAESFTDPFSGELWIAEIDESPDACHRFIADPVNVKGTLFRTSGSDERRIAGTKFVQLQIPANTQGAWVMERKSRSRDNWEGFSVYEQNLVTTIRDEKQEPKPIEVVQPMVKGWPWS